MNEPKFFATAFEPAAQETHGGGRPARRSLIAILRCAVPALIAAAMFLGAGAPVRAFPGLDRPSVSISAERGSYGFGIDALKPRRKMRDVRDAELKGFGVRVMPSGTKRYFVHTQRDGQRVWKTVGDAATLTETEARALARELLTALRNGGESDTEAPGTVLFETVAEEVFVLYGRRWKPGTLEVNRIYLRRQILPSFEGRPIGAISREEVQKWFRSLHATPAAAIREPLRVSVAARPCKTVYPRGRALVPAREEGSRDRGCPPARSQAHRGEPGGGAGRRAVDGRADARACRPDDDIALRPCRRPRRAGSSGTDRAGHRDGDDRQMTRAQ